MSIHEIDKQCLHPMANSDRSYVCRACAVEKYDRLRGELKSAVEQVGLLSADLSQTLNELEQEKTENDENTETTLKAIAKSSALESTLSIERKALELACQDKSWQHMDGDAYYGGVKTRMEWYRKRAAESKEGKP